jgi:hypothetical protein
MTAVRLLAFDGLVPRLSPTLLDQTMAQVASNVKLYSKELRYWRGPVLTHSPPSPSPDTYQTLYRLFDSLGGSVFLLWKNEVDVAPSPVADTGESRIYYTGDGPPKKTNFAMATSGAEPYPSASMPMGVAAPTVAPVLAVNVHGTGTIETRAYVYTWVSTFGTIKAESAPSPPASIDVEPDGSTVTVTIPATPPDPAYNIHAWRVYRTVVGATTVGYEFVDEVVIAQKVYADTKTVAQLGEPIGTIGWVPPPDTLAGLVGLPGGALAGFVGNTVYFSEPYFPHAWPLPYAITIPSLRVVGLATSGSDVVVMTDTQPYIIHGGDPGNMYVEKVPLMEPCVAKRTIASDEDGVVYASPNGLISISPAGRGVVTTNLFTADEWRPLIPQTMKAAVMQGRYFGVFPNETPPRALLLSRTDPPALSYLNLPATALHVDARNGVMFYVHDSSIAANLGKIFQLDADEVTPLNYTWRSKRFFNEKAATFSCMRLDADYGQVVDEEANKAQAKIVNDHNAAAYPNPLQGAFNEVPMNTWEINGSTLWNPPHEGSARSVQVVVHGDGEEAVVNLQPLSLDPIRVPPFKCRELEFVIMGNINVRSLHFATTMEELLAT